MNSTTSPITSGSGPAPEPPRFIPRAVYVPTDCEAYAAGHHGAIYGVDEACGQKAPCYTWRFDPAWPIPEIVDGLDRVGRAAWMREEIQAKAEDEDRPGYYDELLEEEIIDPVIVVLIDGEAFLWDGNHRIGASCMTDRFTVPAVIGELKSHNLLSEAA